MLKNISPQNKSFIILFCVAIVGAYLTIVITDNMAKKSDVPPKDLKVTYYKQDQSNLGASVASASDYAFPPFNEVDTANWKTYSNTEYGMSFKYNPAWTVKPGKDTSDGFSVIEIDPGPKFYNIHIYISPAGYYAMEGLPSKTETIAGLEALNVSNLLYGFKSGSLYFTFDNGLSTSMIDGFNALARSVQFR